MNRFLQGTVGFEAVGGYPEGLLNKATEQGIELWNTRRQGLSLFACCRASDYRRLRRPARRCGLRLRVRSRRGLPFLLRPFRARWGLAIGAVTACILLHLLSSRVWVLTVQGNDRLSKEQILQVLEPLGVTVGGNFDTVDIPAAQLAALQQLPDLAWLSVNVSGSVANILVSERAPSLPVEDTAPANIVAACDGVIVDMHVTGGQAAAQIGDAVTAGDLLISGVTDSNVGPLLKRAAGTVTARITTSATVTVPLQETVKREQTRLCRPTVILFGLCIPLYTSGKHQENYTDSKYSYLLKAGDKTLPIGWTVQERLTEKEEVVSRTAEEALAEARRRLAEQETHFTGMTIENCRTEEQITATAVTVTGIYTVVREIGEVQPIVTR